MGTQETLEDIIRAVYKQVVDQTAAHLFAECTDAKTRAMRAMSSSTKGQVWEGLGDHRKAPGMAQFLILAAGCRNLEYLLSHGYKIARQLRRKAPRRAASPLGRHGAGAAYPDNTLRIGRSLHGFLSGRHGFPCK